MTRRQLIVKWLQAIAYALVARTTSVIATQQNRVPQHLPRNQSVVPAFRSGSPPTKNLSRTLQLPRL